MDYTLGDHAKTLKEYKDAVSKDYECIGNEKANALSSWESFIMIYGENHLHKKQPSLKGDFGAVLMESEDPELCRMEKYRKNPNNVCELIDVKTKNTHRDLHLSMAKDMQNIEKLAELIELGSVERIKSEAEPWERESWNKNLWPYIDKLYKFTQKKFKKIYSSSTPEKRIALTRTQDAFFDEFRKGNTILAASMNSRDDKMAERAAEVIERLGSESTATIIVGDAHIPGVAAGIERKFPNRPIVVCRPETSKKSRAKKFQFRYS